tara:strand:- start:1588 stop:1809 length:222 start_codon:yes stop_codon:yes gene_type:complete
MKKKSNVVIDKNSTYGKKKILLINSQGTPEHNKDPIFTMSAHDKSEIFIAKHRLDENNKVKSKKKKKKVITNG